MNSKDCKVASGRRRLVVHWITSLWRQYCKTIPLKQLLRGLLFGVVAGMVGVIIIYLLGERYAADLTTKTINTLRGAYKPGIEELIYSQAMAESLSTANSQVGNEVQTDVLALALALKEMEDFNVDLASYEIEAVGMALDNACLEHRILAVSFERLTGNPQPSPSCPDLGKETELDNLDRKREAAERQYQNLLTQIAMAHVSANFEGDPRAEVTAARLGRQATIEAFKVGRLKLAEALILVEKGDIVGAIEFTRGYAVSSQSELQALERIVSYLAYIVPHSQNWHERHHDEIASPLWTKLKVGASELERNMAFVVSATGEEYKRLGGVEGSISLYLEEQRQQKGQALAQAQQSVATKEQYLSAAVTNANKLRTLLLSTSQLTSARVESQTKSLLVLLAGVQMWHLTWGVLTGLVCAVLGEFISRIRHLILRVLGLWWSGRPYTGLGALGRHHPDAIFPIVGLMFGMLFSIRLGDRLDAVTDTVISPLVALATSWWWGYLGSVLIIGAMGIFIGGISGNVLTPKALRHPIVKTDICVSGAGGFVAGLIVAHVLIRFLGPHDFLGKLAVGNASVHAQFLALGLVGGVFGSLIGSSLLARKVSISS